MPVQSRAQSAAASAAPPTIVRWQVPAYVKLTVTPNFNAGFGAVRAVTGTQPAPVPGPNASLQGGAVDFGIVQQGVAYLYRNAAHINVVSNGTAFKVYAEGSADFTGVVSDTYPGVPAQSGSGTLPLSQTLFFLPSSGANTGFSTATAFKATTGVSAYNSPTIGYTVLPNPIYSGAISGTADLFYDYELKTQIGGTLGNFFVYVVYTVVAT